jgi:DNA-binding SARP family transcriptional activator
MWAQLSEALAGAHINEQQYDTAAMVCRDLLDSDPWRESVWATLMVALYRAGRPNDALSAFADARRRLRNELGLDPGPSLRSLEMMVLTHDQALTAAAPPGVAASIGAVRNAGGLGR